MEDMLTVTPLTNLYDNCHPHEKLYIWLIFGYCFDCFVGRLKPGAAREFEILIPLSGRTQAMISARSSSLLSAPMWDAECEEERI
jgi:hypothetical protein